MGLILDSSVVIAAERREDTIERLLIAATAISLGYSVLTVNLTHFQQVPGLTVVQF